MENISFLLDDNEYVSNELQTDISALLNDFEQIKVDLTAHDEIYVEMKNYDLNYNLKQLFLICEYYGISKNMKTTKMKKQDVIEQLILFEHNFENISIVIRRNELWYYINELKNDKFMKKFVLWG